MRRLALHKIPLLLVLVTAVLGLNACPAVATDNHGGPPHIAPIGTSPAGQTYGRWAVEWWQWALGIPSAENPLPDTTGANCAQRQVDKVWFLAGATSTDPIVRACEVPAGQSLFFPLINNVYVGFLNDPPETRTEAFVRNAARCTEPAQISAWIDGSKVVKPTRFFTGPSGSQSPIFNIQLPPFGNLFGFDEATVSPAPVARRRGPTVRGLLASSCRRCAP